MLKILADECIHKDLVLALKQSGLDIKAVPDYKLTSRTDDEVFSCSVKNKRILLTFDRGFGDIFRFSISKSYGVVIILVSKMSKEEIVQIVTSFFSKITNLKDLKGQLVVIGKTKIRIVKR